MKRWNGFLLACGLMTIGSSTSLAQDVSPGDPAGFGRLGLSNAFGYGFRGPRGQGYWPGLYVPFDRADGPQVYYGPEWSGLNGTPRPDVARRGWSYSPPWSSAYRHEGGAAKPSRLFARRHRRD